MKKKLIFSVYLLAFAVTVINTVFCVRDSVHVSMDNLPLGNESHSSYSPDGAQILKVYQIKNTIGTAVRAEIADKNGTRNIYWQTDISDVEYSWFNDRTVIINNIRINSVEGSYDCRRGYSIFSEGSLEGLNNGNPAKG